MKAKTVLPWVSLGLGALLIVGGLADRQGGLVIAGAILIGSALIARAVERD